MNAATLLCDRARASADRVAMLDGSAGPRWRGMTFRELDAATAHASARLRAAGLRPGDVVLVMVPMSLELYIALIGILRAGLVAMFLDPSAGRKHIESSCAASRPRAFIGTPKAQLLRLVSPAVRRIPVKFSTGTGVLPARVLFGGREGLASTEIERCAPGAPALIRFTSGSTGAPKPSVRTHGFLVEQQRALERSLRLEPGLVDLVTLPIFVLANLASGVTSLIPRADLRAPGTIDPAPVIRQLLAARAQRVSASPAFLERLADFCREHSQKLDCLQSIYTGGAPVFPHLLDRFQDMAPRAEIVAVYGSTEAEPMAQTRRCDITEADRDAMANGRGLLVGRPDPGLQLRIRPEVNENEQAELTAAQFGSSCLPAGEPGEIVVSGPHVNPGAGPGTGDSQRLRVDGTGWLRTGDAGYLDSGGRLWLLGRCSARVRDSFGTIYPFQAECAALRHPGVRRAAFVSNQGERTLVVEASNGLDAAGLKARLAWSNVERVQVVRRIPMDQRHNAKVDYQALWKLLGVRKAADPRLNL